MKATFLYVNKSKNTKTIILEVSPNNYKKIMSRKQIFVGSQICKVYEEYGIVQCYKCYKFGHKSNNCTNDIDICKKCAGSHRSDKSSSNDIKCVNCSNYNLKDKNKVKVNTNHEATNSKMCEMHKMMIKQIKLKTDYGN